MLLFKDKRYERFFSPLCSRNKELYYDCIKLLIEKSQEVPELYEEDARKFLRSYIENLGYDFQDDTGIEMKADLLSNSRSDADNANTIIRYFRKCGWIADPEIGRNGEGILIITPYCISLIKALEQNFGEDVNATMTNHILDMHGIFKDMFTAGHARALNPYSTALAPLADRAFGLKMELLKLKDNIRDISKEIMTLTETNQLGQFQLKNELLDRFFHDYFNLKNDGCENYDKLESVGLVVRPWSTERRGISPLLNEKEYVINATGMGKRKSYAIIKRTTFVFNRAIQTHKFHDFKCTGR